ncbi:MAG: hypothetical protein SFU53_14055 [Terrimicrobiaceae bacterium]|nr:hypothetical protein [Terrimicrobiaceae bacterium]
MNSDLQAFSEALATRPELRDELQAVIEAGGTDLATRVADFAASRGFAIPSEQLLSAFQTGELSEDELQAVAGGSSENSMWASILAYGITCVTKVIASAAHGDVKACFKKFET